MVFIIHFKDGTRRQFRSSFDDMDEAYDDVYARFPDAEYIETL